MKKVFYKNIRLNILHTKGRFISIFLIIILGTAMFSGLRNTPSSMSATINQYLKDNHYAHLTYLSSLGFTQEDIDLVKNTKGIDQVSIGYQFDAQFNSKGAKKGITVYSSESYHNKMLNRPVLHKGRYPSSENECLIDENIRNDEYDLNKKITLTNDYGSRTYKIVGIIEDVRYISSIDRGTNRLGDGTNQGYIQILNKDALSLALPSDIYTLRKVKTLYTAINVTVKNGFSYDVFSNQYKEYIDVVNGRIKSVLTQKMNDVYDSLTSSYKQKLKQAQNQYKSGLNDYNNKYKDFKSQFALAKTKLINAKLKLTKEKKKYYENLSKLNKAKNQYTSQLKELGESIKQLKRRLEDLRRQNNEEDVKKLQEQIKEITNQLEKTEQFIDGAEILADNENKIKEAKMKLDQAELELSEQENKLTLKEIETEKAFNQSKEILDSSQEKIEQAREEINKIPKGKLYSLSLSENAGLFSYDSNIDAISSIADIFPLIFFLVAALVSLTTMTRMVEEQRGQAGILRALGYQKRDILNQYIIYVLLATLPAGIIGILFGNQFFPRIIVYLYNIMMYRIKAETILVQSPYVLLISVFISVFITLGVTLIVCINELYEMPSVLMRPKSPKPGQRILLERMTFIWKKMSFNQKVTLRNLFIYKARFFMSVIGIAGCTGLIMTGFGIKNSVTKIIPLQYNHILKYDGIMHLEKNYNYRESEELKAEMKKLLDISSVTLMSNSGIQIRENNKNLYASLSVYTNADEITSFIAFENYKTSKPITVNQEGVVISQKTAELLKVKKGESIHLIINDENIEVKVTDIFKNYYIHYVYMDKNLYESLTGLKFKANTGYLKLSSEKKSAKNTISRYLQTKQIGSIEYLSHSSDELTKRMQSLNVIVFILIAFAAVLCFIVLYNLTHINIGERKSEIATIKVLGFRKKEYYDYIFRENIILSFFGTLLGFIIGIMLHRFIILSVEFDATLFIRDIPYTIYLISFLITIGFTYIINLIMRPLLEKIDMVESLKSIE